MNTTICSSCYSLVTLASASRASYSGSRTTRTRRAIFLPSASTSRLGQLSSRERLSNFRLFVFSIYSYFSNLADYYVPCQRHCSARCVHSWEPLSISRESRGPLNPCFLLCGLPAVERSADSLESLTVGHCRARTVPNHHLVVL
jgi:hypothetical protein